MSQKQLKLKVIIHAFELSRSPSSERHEMPSRAMGVIGNESCGLERTYGYLYVYFEEILGFTRNEQMGCLEAFRCNANGAKHMRNVTSHVGSPRNFLGEYMTRPGKVQKCRKNSQN